MNKQFRIPEISLGTFLAIALISLGLVVGSTLLSERTTQAPSGNEVGETFWQRTTKDPTAFFALWTAAFTGVLAISTIFLWNATKRTAQIAERALSEVERPWLFIEGATVSRRDLPGEPMEPNNWFISFRCRNVGRTPAVVEECIIQLHDKDQLPETPHYDLTFRGPVPRWLSANETFDTHPMGPAIRIKDGRAIQFVVFGRLAYKELNGKEHHSGFAVEVSPHVAAFWGYPNDAYDYYD